MISAYISTLLHDTIALVTILNPIAAASIMISMVSPATPGILRPIAWRATLTVFIASLTTLFSGELVFRLFGINVLSIKVIGGIILMMIAINMAYGQASKARHTPEERDEAEEKEDISVIPLGIPILFGPGVIATIIVLNHANTRTFGEIGSYLLVCASILLSIATVYLSLRYAGIINRFLGITGMKILTRIMGLVVGAIAAQFLVDGIKGLWMQAG
ncbi:MarC family protein [Hydrogenimonas sp.]